MSTVFCSIIPQSLRLLNELVGRREGELEANMDEFFAQKDHFRK
jgi:hypothetical protein